MAELGQDSLERQAIKMAWTAVWNHQGASFDWDNFLEKAVFNGKVKNAKFLNGRIVEAVFH